MKNSQRVALGMGLAVAGIGVIASDASAGTSVTNSYSTRHIRGGRAEVNFNNYSYRSIYQYNTSESLKAESYGGDINTASVSTFGGALYGSAYSANRRPVDPVAIISKSKQVETVYGYDTSSVSGVETYSFTGTERSHTVSSDSF